ncbi:MAG: pyruvate kinase [Gammaproteobacteria bacterium]
MSVRRRTKIVVSLGPSTDRPKTMAAMIEQGIDVVRLNMSHGSREDHRRRAQLVRDAAAQQGRAIGLLVDLQGPKIRIGGFSKGKVQLRNGRQFTIDAALGDRDGNEEQVGTSYAALVNDVTAGDRLLLDDGNIVLEVEKVEGSAIKTRVIVGGELSDSKGINKLGGGLSAEALTEKDLEDIRFAAEIGADYLGVSFVRHGADVETARMLLRSAGSDAHVVSKIERREAIDNMQEIIAASDVIMVARGDLGVEIGDAEVPGVQKRLITESRAGNTVVITATQMMQSMVTSPQPTRAEVSDVANAVLDGTDAVMLSAESAVGRHPVKVVAALDRICLAAERHRSVLVSSHRMESQFESVEETIAMATMYTANHYNVVGILTLTESGTTAKWMSRISSGIPIYGVTRKENTERRMSLYRGVYPIAYDATELPRGDVNRAVVAELQSRGLVHDGDWLIITKGDFSGIEGGTNSMKIVKVGEIAGERD